MVHSTFHETSKKNQRIFLFLTSIEKLHHNWYSNLSLEKVNVIAKILKYIQKLIAYKEETKNFYKYIKQMLVYVYQEI